MNSLINNIPITRFGKVRSWLELVRLSNSPTIVSNVLAGSALALYSFSFVQAGLLVLTMLFAYWSGMILNDVFDRRIDTVNSPSRPLPSGRITSMTALLVAFVMMCVAFMIMRWFSVWTATAFLGLTALIVIYNLWHKSNLISPLIMGLCRAFVYVVCAVAFSATLPSQVLVASLGLLFYTLALTAAAKKVNRGRVPGFIVKLLLLIPAIVVPAFINPQITVSLFISLVVYMVWLLWTTSGSQVEQGGVVIARLIAGISLYDGVVMAASGWIPGMYAAVVCFGLTLFLQRYIKGI